MWKDVTIEPFNYSQTGLGPFGCSFDLFNDGTVQFITTPGHSQGLSATLITGDHGQEVLLASNTGYTQESIDKLYTPGITVNRQQAVQSIGWVQERANQHQVIETLTIMILKFINIQLF